MNIPQNVISLMEVKWFFLPMPNGQPMANNQMGLKYASLQLQVKLQVLALYLPAPERIIER